MVLACETCRRKWSFLVMGAFERLMQIFLGGSVFQVRSLKHLECSINCEVILKAASSK